MKYICIGLSFLVLIACHSATAKELELEYKSFYSHVRKLDNDQMNLLQFSFGFQHIETGKLCEIKTARISTQKQQIPITISSENRFNLPKERVLKLADAKVILELVEATNKCDMSVQLETKNEVLKSTYTQQELTALFTQYATFFEDMGGFLSFMMPSVEGLVFHFEEGDYRTLNDGFEVSNGRLEMNEQQLMSVESLVLNEKPLRITALTQSL
ncbi:MAG: DUF2987 domain-containing protein [Pseudomonadota bacterium]